MAEVSLSNDERERLLNQAQAAARNAYAPYSHFRVGAAVLTRQGNIFSGCNVENASYGLTVCAERTAIFSGVAEEGGDDFKVRALVAVNADGEPISPCGACRQVLFEFGPEAVVLLRGSEMLASEALPHGFRLESRIAEKA